MTKILYIYHRLYGFPKHDLTILNKYYDIITCNYKNKKDIFEIKKYVKKVDLVYSWFTSDHSGIAVYYAKKYNKKSIVCAGGGDCAFIPKINYGYFLKLKGRIISKYIFKKADRVLVVDPSLQKQVEYMFRRTFDNIVYVPTGYNPDYFKPKGEKEDIILTVGDINHSNLKRKGIEIFVRIASYFPDYKFIVIGNLADDSIDYLKSISSDNIKFTGFLKDKDLLNYYQRSKIYCQFSKHEGLPNSLCEAMLCNCLPIGTYENGIPRAIGNTGFYVSYGDINETVDVLDQAINSNKNNYDPRNRIKKLFPIQKREKKLLEIINEICLKSGFK